MRITLPVVPVPKPRMTQADKWKKRPAVLRYRDFCDQLRAAAEDLGFTVPEAGMGLSFRIPMPDSWSKKKRAAMEGTPHQQRPDVDNLVKAVLDALLPEDSRVWHLSGIEKRWAAVGCIDVFVDLSVTNP